MFEMDILYGGAVGVAQIVVGHPLDTIKVLQQNNQSIRLRYPQYYRGAAYPFMCSVLFNATVFPIHERSTFESHYVSGACAGIVSPIVYLFDLAKIKRQVAKPIRWSKGLPMTFARETIAMSLYFGIYHDLKDHGIFVAGGVAGMLSWALTYPIDTIRSRQISQNIGIVRAAKSNLYRGFGACMLRAFLVNGISFKIYELKNI